MGDLELKFDTQLEEIELLQNELEEQKEHSDMLIERLKQQLVEITADLQVKERELRNLRFRSLFESPRRSKSGKDKDKESKPSLGHQQSLAPDMLRPSQSKRDEDF